VFERRRASARGTPSALSGGVGSGVKHHHDLIVWQLARELRREVFGLLRSSEAARRDLTLRYQLLKAVRKIAPNIAEGFRRFHPRDIAHFLTYAYAGAAEVSEWLDDGEESQHWTDAELAAARRLLRRLDKGLSGFIRYLNDAKAPGR